MSNDHQHADHGHDHGHAHAHGHSHAPANFDTAFAVGVGLNLTFVIAETIYGFQANSLALLADAAHNLSDVAGLLLAWGASWLGRKKPTARRSYGYRSASILAALINAALLLLAVGGILLESARRFMAPEPITGSTVIWVALLGIAINGATALLFMRGRKSDLNIRGAFLHMTADAVVSLGVVIATLAGQATGWLWLDPATGLAIALVILYGTWGLGRDSFNLAFDATPEGIDPEAVKKHLEQLPGVTEVHDLHIWAMSTTETALTAHLVRPGSGLDDAFIADVCSRMEKRFSIRHTTLQIEAGDPAHPCHLAPAEVV
ncbi:MAG: cation transporter [Proteobacteria bacterium]|nr:cation transporter [Pseudomonadota bacterium]